MTATAICALADADSESRFGGKAAQLGAATRAGFRVPYGIALDWEVAALIARRDGEAQRRCRDACADLGGALLAVRSSAIGEDSAGASFAGQHLTRLNVAPADVIDAVIAVCESARAAGALAYRRQLGVAGEPRMGVVIQRMVDAACAGVMFTRDPVTRADVRIIEAVPGLGEPLVSGEIDPDRYRGRRGGPFVVEALAGAARCLDDGQLAALDALADECDRVFGDGEGHDIEWAFDRDALYLVQRRAITR
jgi:pyruvate, water dikinase